MGGKSWLGLLVAAALLAGPARSETLPWERLEGCRLVDSPHNDGDSVEVEHQGTRRVFRLYFVDCFEKSPHSVKRRAEQARYFGLQGERAEEEAVQLAYEAARFTRDQLTAPFTVFTRNQKVDSRGTNPSVRAFVETADGKDLGLLLVEAGLAIIREGRAASDHPSGKTPGEMVGVLRGAETRARLAGRGSWALAPGWKSAAPPVVGREFSASDRTGILAAAGRPARVRGRVSRIGALPDGRITFVDFDGGGRDAFVGVIRADFLPAFQTRFPEGLEAALSGQEVMLEGVITLYRNIPQIELQRPGQLTVVPAKTPEQTQNPPLP